MKASEHHISQLAALNEQEAAVREELALDFSDIPIQAVPGDGYPATLGELFASRDRTLLAQIEEQRQQTDPDNIIAQTVLDLNEVMLRKRGYI